MSIFATYVMRIALPVIAATLHDLPDAGSAPSPHIAEVKSYASSAAVTLVVSARWPDLGVNHELLESFKHDLAIVDADKPALKTEVQYVVGVLKGCHGRGGEVGPPGAALPIGFTGHRVPWCQT